MSHGSPAFIVFGRKANDCIDWKEREERGERILRTKESSFKESQQSNTSIFFPFKIPFSISLSLCLSLSSVRGESVEAFLPSFLLRALDLVRVNEKSPFQIFNSRFEAPFSSLQQKLPQQSDSAMVDRENSQE
ncbi:hypothetical protein ACFX12_022704 [Malus domestica]